MLVDKKERVLRIIKINEQWKTVFPLSDKSVMEEQRKRNGLYSTSFVAFECDAVYPNSTMVIN